MESVVQENTTHWLVTKDKQQPMYKISIEI